MSNQLLKLAADFKFVFHMVEVPYCWEQAFVGLRCTTIIVQIPSYRGGLSFLYWDNWNHPRRRSMSTLEPELYLKIIYAIGIGITMAGIIGVIKSAG